MAATPAAAARPINLRLLVGRNANRFLGPIPLCGIAGHALTPAYREPRGSRYAGNEFQDQKLNVACRSRRRGAAVVGNDPPCKPLGTSKHRDPSTPLGLPTVTLFQTV